MIKETFEWNPIAVIDPRVGLLENHLRVFVCLELECGVQIAIEVQFQDDLGCFGFVHVSWVKIAKVVSYETICSRFVEFFHSDIKTMKITVSLQIYFVTL